jgi:FixJ family two-component response regulator
MAEKILFVDDEPAVLDGYQRSLHREFQIETAVGGEQGLLAIAQRGPFAVVVSDMRMPKMSGAEFLAAVKTRTPDTVRVVLTGHADIESAINAVNEGAVFCFLTKPCPKDVLSKSVLKALTQYRLINAEKELLEKTLRGSIQVMAEILSVINPSAFGRATRIRRYVQHVAKKLGLQPAWQFEVAAMLSQLGCVTLHPDTIEAINAGQNLSTEEQARFDKHPSVAWGLLSRIPRMEEVSWMILQQHQAVTKVDPADIQITDAVQCGAHLLRSALAYDRLLSRGSTIADAIAALRWDATGIDLKIANALADLEPADTPTQVRLCKISELAQGMILEEDVRTKNGMLVVSKGQEISSPLAMRLNTFWQHGVIPASVRVKTLTSETVV